MRGVGGRVRGSARSWRRASAPAHRVRRRRPIRARACTTSLARQAPEPARRPCSSMPGSRVWPRRWLGRPRARIASVGLFDRRAAAAASRVAQPRTPTTLRRCAALDAARLTTSSRRCSSAAGRDGLPVIPPTPERVERDARRPRSVESHWARCRRRIGAGDARAGRRVRGARRLPAGVLPGRRGGGAGGSGAVLQPRRPGGHHAAVRTAGDRQRPGARRAWPERLDRRARTGLLART